MLAGRRAACTTGPPVFIVCTYRSGSANEMPRVAASAVAAETALALVTWISTMSPRLSAELPIRCRAARVSACAVDEGILANKGRIEVAPSFSNAVFTAGLDVRGARRPPPWRSRFPVTEEPASTAITVPGTTPVFWCDLASVAGLGAGWLPTAGLAVRPTTVTAVTPAAASLLRRIHPVALINVLPPATGHNIPDPVTAEQ